MVNVGKNKWIPQVQQEEEFFICLKEWEEEYDKVKYKSSQFLAKHRIKLGDSIWESMEYELDGDNNKILLKWRVLWMHRYEKNWRTSRRLLILYIQ